MYLPFVAPGCGWIWLQVILLPTPALKKQPVNLTIFPESDPALLSSVGHVARMRARKELERRSGEEQAYSLDSGDAL